MRSSADASLSTKPAAPASSDVPQHVVVVERREHEHRRRVAPARQRAGGRDAVDPAHADVHQHDVGPVLRRRRRRPRRRRRTRRRPRSRRPGPRMRATPARTTGWSSTMTTRITATRSRSATAAIGRRASTRQPSAVGPASNCAAERPGPLGHADEAEVQRRADRAAAAGRPRSTTTQAHAVRRRTSTRSSTRLRGACRATLARPSRAIRCTAMPTGPVEVGRRLGDRRARCRGRLGGTRRRARRGRRRRQRRIRAPLVGPQRGDRRPDLVEARPADRLGVEQRPLGLGEVPAQHVTGAGDVQQHRRRGCARRGRAARGRCAAAPRRRPGRRAPAGPARAPRSAVAGGTRPRPSGEMKMCAIAHGAHTMPESGARSSATSHGATAATAMIARARVSDPRCDAVL